MRILYHHRTQGRGAEGNHIVSIVGALRELGHEVDVLSPPGVDPFDAGATLPADSPRVRVRGWSSVWRFLGSRMPTWVFELAEIAYNVPAWIRVSAALRRRSYDVVFERYAAYLVVGAIVARRAKCRFVLEVNDVAGVAQRVRRQVFPRLCAFFEASLIARCDLAHAVSSYLGERLIERGLPRERLVVVPNGFDVSKMHLSHSRAEMRARYGLDQSVVIGFAGWFVGWDRLDFLVEVFAAARRACLDLKLCLVGDGEPMDDVRKLIVDKSLQDVFVHTGPVARSEVYDHIGMFDIGVLPHSNLFGSPMIMFEMMALNVPVIAPRLPPIEDVLRDGSTALLFQPLDLHDCVRQVIRLVTDSRLRASLAKSAFDVLANENSWSRVAERIISALPAQETASASHLP